MEVEILLKQCGCKCTVRKPMAQWGMGRVNTFARAEGSDLPKERTLAFILHTSVLFNVPCHRCIVFGNNNEKRPV